MLYKIENDYLNLKIGIVVPFLFLSLIFLQCIVHIQFAPSINSLIYICIFIVFFKKYKPFRKIVYSKSLCVWGVLILYHLVNASIKNVPEVDIADYLHGLKMFASISIFTFLLSVDMKKTLTFLIYSCVVWFSFALTTSGIHLRSEFNQGINAITYGKIATCMAIYIMYLGMLNYSSMVKVCIKCTIPFIVVLAAQTRNSFAMIVFQLIGYYYGISLKAKIRLKNMLMLFLLAVILYYGIDYILHYTELGNRFLDQDDVVQSQINNGIYTNSIWGKILGERLSYYVYGFQLFLANPLTGIGYNNYQYVTGGDYPMHPEYMLHVCEGGIVAIVFFSLFVLEILKIIIKAKISQSVRVMLFATFCAIMFSHLYATMFDQELIVILYCLILSVNQSYSILRKNK